MFEIDFGVGAGWSGGLTKSLFVHVCGSRPVGIICLRVCCLASINTWK